MAIIALLTIGVGLSRHIIPSLLIIKLTSIVILIPSSSTKGSDDGITVVGRLNYITTGLDSGSTRDNVGASTYRLLIRASPPLEGLFYVVESSILSVIDSTKGPSSDNAVTTVMCTPRSRILTGFLGVFLVGGTFTLFAALLLRRVAFSRPFLARA